jgi:hypothetical protein
LPTVRLSESSRSAPRPRRAGVAGVDYGFDFAGGVGAKRWAVASRRLGIVFVVAPTLGQSSMCLSRTRFIFNAGVAEGSR